MQGQQNIKKENVIWLAARRFILHRHAP